MAIPVSATGIRTIDAIIQGSKWDRLHLTYSSPDGVNVFGQPGIYGTPPFADYDYGEIRNFHQANMNLRVFAESALLDEIATFTNLTFSWPDPANYPVSDYKADIRWAHAGKIIDAHFQDFGENRTAMGMFPDMPNGGDIWFKPGSEYANPKPGNYAGATVLHEIGHTLGLKHPHDDFTGTGVVMPKKYHSVEYTIMSYRSYVGA